MTVDIDESQRQMILLALAELALSRPGWHWTLGETAKLFQGEALFEEFKRLNADRVKAERMPLCGPFSGDLPTAIDRVIAIFDRGGDRQDLAEAMGLLQSAARRSAG